LKPPGKPQEFCPAHQNQCALWDEIERLRAECERLRKLTRVDSLTGFYNFRHLVEALEGEMERTRRTGFPTGLIMIDLDHFKYINDTYGHETGNLALRWCAKVWRERIRRIDIPCRYGGEEFTIILPGTRLPQAIKAAERMRLALAESPFHSGVRTIPITASFGVDVYTAREYLSASEFIKRADRCLMDAKQNGRNRVCYPTKKEEPTPTQITQEEKAALSMKPPRSKD